MPGVAFSTQISALTPPEGSSVKTARPVAFDPLFDSIVALAEGAEALLEAADVQEATRAPPARAAAARYPSLFITSSSFLRRR